MARICDGIAEPANRMIRAWAKPKRRQPIAAPIGFQLPKITAARAINPWPEITVVVKFEIIARV